MKNESPPPTEILLDNQRLTLVRGNYIRKVLERGTYRGDEIRALAVARSWVRRFVQFDELALGLAKWPHSAGWMPFVLVEIDQEWFRIELQRRVCEGCGSWLLVGVASYTDLLILVQDPSVREARMLKHRYHCPVCRAYLSVTWVRDVSGEPRSVPVDPAFLPWPRKS